MNTVLDYIKANPSATKAGISEATGMKGLLLFNLLKKMVNDGQITIEGEGNDSTYHATAVEAASEERTDTETPDETLNSKETNGADTTEENDVANDATADEAQSVVTETKPAAKHGRRNMGTFRFDETSYNKGKLIHAVVTAYCGAHKNITHDKLKQVFPDALLKRFGIFQTIEKARELSGAKYDRYFFKEEFQVTLKDCVIVTCNQITSENILPFLEVAAKLGYTITAE